MYEQHHNSRIDDEMVARIRRSRFMVADFTGNRPNVYFEAGFALGLGVPVVWTRRKDAADPIHFDNRQYNFIEWQGDNLPEFRKQLQLRIEATIGRGKWKAPT
jgi:nucleoside 2-deoxyribosyltransferase